MENNEILVTYPFESKDGPARVSVLTRPSPLALRWCLSRVMQARHGFSGQAVLLCQEGEEAEAEDALFLEYLTRSHLRVTGAKRPLSRSAAEEYRSAGARNPALRRVVEASFGGKGHAMRDSLFAAWEAEQRRAEGASAVALAPRESARSGAEFVSLPVTFSFPEGAPMETSLTVKRFLSARERDDLMASLNPHIRFLRGAEVSPGADAYYRGCLHLALLEALGYYTDAYAHASPRVWAALADERLLCTVYSLLTPEDRAELLRGVCVLSLPEGGRGSSAG